MYENLSELLFEGRTLTKVATVIDGEEVHVVFKFSKGEPEGYYLPELLDSIAGKVLNMESRITGLQNRTASLVNYGGCK